ncbi:hypothetical protein B0H13DRAFT_1896771 [Mycena leptocephala]|nr:hypothetical protein B0H13DRAFT_1896771 [Mycena leptocephala]
MGTRTSSGHPAVDSPFAARRWPPPDAQLLGKKTTGGVGVHVGAEEGGERGPSDAKRKTARSCARPSVISIISQWNIGKKSSNFIEPLGKKLWESGAGEREEEGNTGKEEAGLG